MQETLETRVQSLGRKDPLEEKMATHSSVLAWRIPWTEKSGGLQPMGLHRVGHDRACTLGMHNQGVGTGVGRLSKGRLPTHSHLSELEFLLAEGRGFMQK